MTPEKIKQEEYIIYRNNGIGIIAGSSLMLFKEQEIEQIKLKILFPVNNDSNFTNNNQFCLFLMIPEMMNKIRGPLSHLEVLDLFAYVREFQGIVTAAPLLEDDFKIDLFQWSKGTERLIILHDYLYHALINSQQICSNYFFMYENAIKHLALEMAIAGEFNETDCRDIVETMLFLNHAKRNCKNCLRKREEEYTTIQGKADEYFDVLFDVLSSGKMSSAHRDKISELKEGFVSTILD